MDGQSEALVKGPLPPHVQLHDFLPEPDRAELLDWVLANSDRFKPAKVTYGRADSHNRLAPEVRIASILRDLGPLEAKLRTRLLDALPEVLRHVRVGGPQLRTLELELAAHGDGAHFAPHIDLPVGQNRKPLGAGEGEDRLLSAVYYFHREPKGFSGGELRLYRIGAKPLDGQVADGDFVELEPLQNSLVVFPSWAAHEVRPVRCPSGDFADRRFALNCWYCGTVGKGRG